jgi:tripartite-type tricarboxylate transporter receptor subunit TctC
MHRFVVMAAALAAAAVSFAASAQSYPTKPVRIVVPYTAGGPADLLVRGLGQKMTETWGQQVIVDNRPGANEIIAADAVAKSPGDGYTLLVASDAVFSLNPYLYSKIPYDPVKDFVPVSKLVNANLMMVARPDFPGSTVADVIEYAKRNPGKVNYGSVGAGGVNHLAMSWFANQHGLKMEHVPYKGLVQALQDVAEGRIDVMYAVIGGAAPLIAGGKLKPIAVSGAARNSLLPNVPTFNEAGYPKADYAFFFGLVAPVGTPPEIVSRIAAEAARIVNAPEFREKYLQNLGFVPVGDTPAQFGTFLKADRELARERVAVSGAKLD